jgi:two-component system sensor histidine kinase UhpB
MSDRGPRHRAPSLPLFWRVFLTNALIVAIAWSVLAFSSASIRSPLNEPDAGIAGVVALVAMLVINLLLTRRFFRPLDRLRALMARADPLRPGLRLPVATGTAPEVAELTRAFNDMLERLERERRQSAGRALEAQEGERLRLARELHDEIGQRLTGLILLLEYAARQDASTELAGSLAEAREEARECLEDLRRVATRLRPEALDDLGLRSALAGLCERVSAPASFRLERELDPSLPSLSHEQELVIYRVAQEALTNAVRHSDAERVRLALHGFADGVRLEVQDDGRGMDGAAEGAGLTGMRERALLIGAELEIISRNGGGTLVQLAVEATDR